MTPVAADLLLKAHTSLANARIILAAGVPDVAAREACLAAFHAAQALIRERRGRVPRTHAGVHGAFDEIVATEAGLDRSLGRFLPQAYEYKDIADYSTTRTISPATAEAAIAEAGRFVAAVEGVLGGG
jgi:uncharacterized protein (UPF0332 family)